MSKEKTMAETRHSRINGSRHTAFLIYGLILAGCSSEMKEQVSTTAGHEAAKDPVNITAQAPAENQAPVLSCNCNPAKNYDSQEIRVSFSHWTYLNDRNEFDSIYRHYSHDSIRLHVRAIELNGFDSIPSVMRTFKYLEHIYLTGSGDLFGKTKLLKGLDNFPKLVSVNLEGCNLSIDSTHTWLRQVETLFISKSKLKGLTSFKHTPRLKSLIIGHSGFEYFPKDFNALSCLQELNIEEYKFGKDHPRLEEIDLRNFACLRIFRVWGGASGLPQGVDSIGKIELILRPWAMSDAGLKTYKAWKKRIKNAG